MLEKGRGISSRDTDVSLPKTGTDVCDAILGIVVASGGADIMQQLTVLLAALLHLSNRTMQVP